MKLSIYSMYILYSSSSHMLQRLVVRSDSIGLNPFRSVYASACMISHGYIPRFTVVICIAHAHTINMLTTYIPSSARIGEQETGNREAQYEFSSCLVLSCLIY